MSQTVQAIATVDSIKKQATVLLGGGNNAINLQLNNLSSSVFGTTVDVTVARDNWSGYEGSELQPKVFMTQRYTLSSGTPTISIPNTDPMAGYQVIITPAATTTPVVDTTWSTSVQAENTTLANVTAYSQDTDANPQLYATSGKVDVGNLTSASSSLTWNVTVPTTGTYRLGIYDGANGAPGQHALFLDGTFNQTVQYTADLGWTYRNRTDVFVSLTAGAHALSLRTSRDGATLLPTSNITVDKFDLTQVSGTESATYPARYARATGSPTFVFGLGPNGALVTVGPSTTATFFIAATDTGYYDVSMDYRTPSGATALTFSLNGRTISGMSSTAAGSWTSTARLHLAAGISEIQVSSPGVAQLDTLRTVRATTGDSSTHTIEAESGTVSGTAQVTTLAASSGSNDSGGAEVTFVGNGSANTLTLARPSGTPAGLYDLDVHYANDDANTASHYNTDVITRFMNISESGGNTVQGAFRNDYSWTSFWWKTVPLSLVTSSGSLALGNSTAYAPDLDEFRLSPLELSSSTVSSAG